MNDLSPHWPSELARAERSVTSLADSPHALLHSAVTCLYAAEHISSSTMALHLIDQALGLVERAALMLTGDLAERAGVVAEHCRVALRAFPSGASAIEYVRALRDAVGEAA